MFYLASDPDAPLDDFPTAWRKLAPNRIDPRGATAKNKVMNADVISAQALKELEETLLREPDRATMREACQEMDRMREETRQRVGIVDVAVEFIRDARDQ